MHFPSPNLPFKLLVKRGSGAFTACPTAKAPRIRRNPRTLLRVEKKKKRKPKASRHRFNAISAPFLVRALKPEDTVLHTKRKPDSESEEATRKGRGGSPRRRHPAERISETRRPPLCFKDNLFLFFSSLWQLRTRPYTTGSVY